jgi:peptide-methionine (S)-S-oxide reductase
MRRVLVSAIVGGAAFIAAAAVARAETATAIFAGGCFWCMEKPFDVIDGVKSTTSGYIGGRVSNPTYEQVSEGTTGHAEAVKVEYDPQKVSYDTLLYVFWRNVDPLTPNAQFCDRGTQYRSAIFPVDEAQTAAAEASKAALESAKRFDKPIVTEIAKAGTFYPAEAYHQNYYRTNAVRYEFYRFNCGRDARLKQVWGDEAGGKLPKS